MGNRPKPPTEIPLTLIVDGCWELEEGRIDSVRFLEVLAVVFPEVTIAFIEGTSIDEDVAAALREFAEPGKYLPKSQTIWPAPRQFRCAFGEPLCASLATLARDHAEMEMFDHLFLYANTSPILEWPDAFFNTMWISSSVAESRVAAFAHELGLSYQYARAG